MRDVVLLGTVHADLDGFSRLETALEALRPRAIAVEMSAARANLFEDCHDYDPLTVYREAHEQYLRLIEQYLCNPFLFDLARKRYAGPAVRWNIRQIAAMEAGAKLLRACCGFELRVARRYVDRHPGTELSYIDLPEEDVDGVGRSRTGGGAHGILGNLGFLADNRAALDHGLIGFLALVRTLQDSYYDEAGGFLRRRYEQMTASWDQLPRHDGYRRAVYDPRREPYMADRIKQLRRRTPQGRCVAVIGATHLVGLSRLLRGFPHTSGSLFEVDVLRALAA